MSANPLVDQLRALIMGLTIGQASSDILRVGFDVVDVKTLAQQLESELGSQFAAKLFTGTEIDDCRGEAQRFASRWALKEAVAKAIGTGFRNGLRPDMIEVVTAAHGAVKVQPAPGCSWPDGFDHWSWAASATHDAGLAAAIAVAVRTEPLQEGESNGR